jgi:pimeloyl-ACP methyl ester carboxylesterase
MRRIVSVAAMLLGAVVCHGLAIGQETEDEPKTVRAENRNRRTETGKAPAAQRTTGKTVNLNGMEMYHEVVGKGDPLLLLHGFSSSGRESWTPFVGQLSRKYRLVIPDLRGHGRSTNPSDEFTHRQCALDVCALLDHLGIRQFKAMGISTGGMTLLHLATQQPERIQAMVLIGASHKLPGSPQRQLTEADLLDQDGPWGGYARLRRVHVHGDEQIRKLCRQFLAVADNRDDMNFTRADLAAIKARVLIIHGDRDGFFPVEIPVEMYTSMPNASLWIIPNGGHVPINGERVLFLTTTLAFLEESWTTMDVDLGNPVYPWGPR